MAVLNKKLLAFLCVFAICLNSVTARAKPGDDDWDSWGSEEESEEAAEHDNHDDHGPHSRSAGGGEQNSPAITDVGGAAAGDGKSGFGGSNYANFNETCGSSYGRTCNPYNNLECTASGVCLCKIDPAHTYIKSQEKCHPTKSFGERCEFDDQCRTGRSGYNSRCPERIGTCQCFDTLQNGKREVQEYYGQCVLKRKHNEPCETDAECQVTMKENSYCAPKDARAPSNWLNATQICQCKRGYVWDNLADECLKVADNGLASDCRSDLQCTEYMGLLSRCSRDNKKCECHDASNPGEFNVVYYSKTHWCYQRAFWNTTCSAHEECKASLSSEAECRPSEDLTMQLICQCPLGKQCKDDTKDPDGAVGIVANTATLGLVVGVVIFKQYFRN